MAKYRKKPMIIEADIDAEIYKEGMEDGFEFELNYRGKDRYAPYIKYKDTKFFIEKGDYIFLNEKGNKQILRPHVFHAIYEKVEDA